jgi:hypothetical protein
MRHHDPEREERSDYFETNKREMDDHAGMTWEDKIRYVTRREVKWAKGVEGVWASKIVDAVTNQPGSRPSEIWVERPACRADVIAAYAERQLKWDAVTEGIRIVREELRAVQMRRGGYYGG